MSLALNGYPRVDIESLLFDLKDVLRTSLQVNKAQSAEIARLGGKPQSDLLAAEYTERVAAALTQVDAALDVFESQSYEAASTQYNFDVAGWLQSVQKELGLPVHFESPHSVEAVHADQPTVGAVPTSTDQDVPNDFWNVHDFKWEDEPLSDDGNTFADAEDGFAPDHHKHSAPPSPIEPGNGLIPEEHIPELWLDGPDSDRSSDTPRASNSNFDDSATLYHPEDSSYFLSHRRRHTLLGGKLAAFHGYLSSPELVFTVPPTAASTPPTRAYGLVRTSSAPDLRALRASHDHFLTDDERMLVSAF